MIDDYVSWNSVEAYRKLEKASQDWSEWQKKTIILESGKKAMFSKCFIKHKLESKTVIEAEHKARLDPEYVDIVKQYAESEQELIKARFHYNNLDKYLSLKQSELKRDLALNVKQPN